MDGEYVVVAGLLEDGEDQLVGAGDGDIPAPRRFVMMSSTRSPAEDMYSRADISTVAAWRCCSFSRANTFSSGICSPMGSFLTFRPTSLIRASALG